MSSKSSFERPRHLRVHWDDEPDHPLHGAVIRMKRLSIDELKELASIDLPEDDDDVNPDQFDMIVKRLTSGLVSWNLTDEGEPRPADGAELAEDAELCIAILNKWMHVAGSVPDPLGGRSNSGSPSPAASALTDLPSQSL